MLTLKNLLGHVISSFIFLLLISCGESSDSASDRGYDDGYTVGYNEKCSSRVTMIAGDFDNKNYAVAYDQGYADGSYDCAKKK